MDGCCRWLRFTCARNKFDLLLDGQNWKEVYSASLHPCLPANGVLALRILLAVIWSAIVVWSITDHMVHTHDFGYWMMYLTHWSALTEVIYFWLAAITTWMAVRSSWPDGTGKDTPLLVKITWLCFAVVPTIALIVMLLYWLLVYDPAKTQLSVLNVLMHGVNFGLIVVDFAVFQRPYYLAHIYIPIVWAFCYVIFSVIYHAAGGTGEGQPYIYKALDWNQPARTLPLVIIILVIVVPVVYCVLFCTGGHSCCRTKEGAVELDAESTQVREIATKGFGQTVPEVIDLETADADPKIQGEDNLTEVPV